jgi:hypothetical protein
VNKEYILKDAVSGRKLILEEDCDSDLSENEYQVNLTPEDPNAFDFLTNEGEILANLDDSFSSSEMIIPTIARKQNNFSKIKSSLSTIISGKINGLDLIRIDDLNPCLLNPKTEIIQNQTKTKGKFIIKGKPRLVRIRVFAMDRNGGFGTFNKIIPIKKPFEVLVKHPPYFRVNSIVACKVKVYNNSNTYFQVLLPNETKEETVYSGEKIKRFISVEDQEIPYSIKVKNLTSGEEFKYVIDVPVF